MVNDKHSMSIAKGLLEYKIVKKERSVTNSNQNIPFVHCEALCVKCVLSQSDEKP